MMDDGVIDLAGGGVKSFFPKFSSGVEELPVTEKEVGVPRGKDDELWLAVDLEELGRASTWIEDLAIRDGWAERPLFKLQLGLEEALANIINHGFPADRSVKPFIRVAYERSAGKVWLTISDNGVAFDPSSSDLAPLATSVETASLGGHGIRLMRQLLDEFSYCQIDGDNRLVMGVHLA